MPLNSSPLDFLCLGFVASIRTAIKKTLVLYTLGLMRGSCFDDPIAVYLS